MALQPGLSRKIRLPLKSAFDFAASLRRLWPWLGFMLICVGFAAVPLVNTQKNPLRNKDYVLWYAVGQSVVRGEALYPEAGSTDQYNYTYPPTLAVFLFAPLSMVGNTAFVALLLAGNCMVLYLLVRVGFRLYAGSSRQRPGTVLLMPFLALAIYAYDAFLLGQCNLLLLLLMFCTFAALRAQKPWLAGGALAVATAIKAFPLSALVYLVYRREWRAVAATLAGLVLILVVLPAPIRGFDRNLQELGQWYQGMLADQSGNSMAQRTDCGFSYKNQSVFAVVHRMTRPVVAGSSADGKYCVNVTDLTPRESQLAAYGVILTLGLIYLLCMPGRSRQTQVTQRCEEAMLLLLMVVCSPLAWTYFYCWTFPAWIVIVHQLTLPTRTEAHRRIGFVLGAVIALIMATASIQTWDHTTLALGATFWGGIGLFLMLGWLMRTEVEAESSIISKHERCEGALTA